MAITTISLVDNIKEELSDLAGALFNETDAKIERLLVGQIMGLQTTWNFQQVVTGSAARWIYRPGPLALWVAGSTYFSSDGDDYTFYAGTDQTPPSIELTSGTDTQEQIVVTGTQVNFREAMAIALTRAGTMADQRANVATGGSSYSTTDVGRKLRRAAAARRGAYAV